MNPIGWVAIASLIAIFTHGANARAADSEGFDYRRLHPSRWDPEHQTITGFIRTEHRSEIIDLDGGDQSDESDQDIFTTFSVKARSSRLGGVEVGLLGRYEGDLNGTASDSPFHDRRDDFDGNQRFLLYRGSLKLKGLLPRFELTLGRQFIYSVDTAHLDGASARYEDIRTFGGGLLSVDAFVGRQVYLYGNDPEDQAVTGGGVTWSFDSGTRLRLSDLYFGDTNSAELSVDQLFAEELYLHGAASMIESELSRIRFDADYYVAATRTSVQASLERRFGAAYRDASDYDYTSSKNGGADDDFDNRVFIRRRRHSTMIDFLVIQELTSWLYAHLGYSRLLVDGAGGEDAFNVNTDEVSAGLETLDKPWKGLRLQSSWNFRRRDLKSPSADFEDIDGDGERSFHELELSASQLLWRDKIKASVGYSLVVLDRENRFVEVEDEDSEAYFVSAELRLRDDVIARARYETQTALDATFPGVDRVHSFRMSIEWRLR